MPVQHRRGVMKPVEFELWQTSRRITLTVLSWFQPKNTGPQTSGRFLPQVDRSRPPSLVLRLPGAKKRNQRASANSFFSEQPPRALLRLYAAILRPFCSGAGLVAGRARPFDQERRPLSCLTISFERGTNSVRASPIVRSFGSSPASKAR